MPAYSFQALDAQGKSHQGVVDADTARAARGVLRGRALVPLSVEPLGTQATTAASGSRVLWKRRAFNATQLSIWTRQLAGLVSAGLPLERALTSLADEAEHPAQRDVVATVRAEVNSGSTLAAALAQHPGEFSAIFVAVIGAGEHSGNLGLVLDRLAD